MLRMEDWSPPPPETRNNLAKQCSKKRLKTDKKENKNKNKNRYDVNSKFAKNKTQSTFCGSGGVAGFELLVRLFRARSGTKLFICPCPFSL